MEQQQDEKDKQTKCFCTFNEHIYCKCRCVFTNLFKKLFNLLKLLKFLK